MGAVVGRRFIIGDVGVTDLGVSSDAVAKLAVAEERLARHGRQVVGQVQIFQRKVHSLVRFYPAVVDELEPLQVHDLNKNPRPFQPRSVASLKF